MITFSFRPRSRSTLPEMAASVSTRVVSWQEAADRLATEDVEQLLRADRAFGDLLPGLDLLTARNVDPIAVRDGVLSPFLVHAPDHDLVALHARHPGRP